MIPYVILFLCYFYVKCYFSEIPSSGASGGRSWRTVAWDRRQWMSRPWGGEILTPVKGKPREERVQLQMSTDGNDWTAAKQETLRSALGELDGNYTSVKLPHRVATCYCMYVWSEPHRRTGEHPFGGSNRVLPEWQKQLVCHAAPPGRKNNNELLQCLFLTVVDYTR